MELRLNCTADPEPRAWASGDRPVLPFTLTNLVDLALIILPEEEDAVELQQKRKVEPLHSTERRPSNIDTREMRSKAPGILRKNARNPLLQFLSTHFSPCLNPILKMGHFCPSSPFDLPRSLYRFWFVFSLMPVTDILVQERRRMMGESSKSVFGRQRFHTNTACAHRWGFSRKPAEVGVQG